MAETGTSRSLDPLERAARYAADRLRTTTRPPKPAMGSKPLRWRELMAVVLIVALCDAAIYRGHGFAGWAAVSLAVPALLLLGSPQPRVRSTFWVAIALLGMLSARLVWLGSALAVALGIVLILASAMAIAGRRWVVFDMLQFAFTVPAAGGLGLLHYRRTAELGLGIRRAFWLAAILPAAAVLVFGWLFIRANPDLFRSVMASIDDFSQWLSTWFGDFSPSMAEVFFWVLIAIVSVGLLRPLRRSRPWSPAAARRRNANRQRSAGPASMYASLRNTLLLLVALFAAYLVFEFKTLWFREFPKGFYYAGYAHEGAAWLTVALALATAVLSLTFRGPMLADPRLPRLRRLAWIWSAQNLLLALAVYNRMQIYVDFNGMTRMRTIGLFGITAVVVGFGLVIWKIVKNRSFGWLLQSNLTTLAAAGYLFALTPVDALVHSYNVRRVLAGDPAPTVQISVHPINAEGMLVLHPLVDCDDPLIRAGIRALLASRALQMEAIAEKNDSLGWTAFQLSDRLLLERLDQWRPDWEAYLDDSKRNEAIERFDAYVYQWY